MEFLDELSRAHGVPYRLVDVSEGRRSYLMDGIVVLDKNLSSERVNWAYCHELAHHLLRHADNPPRDNAEEREQENDANRYASELLLPAREFAPQSQLSLSELKTVFPYSSHEVIARRRLAFRPGMLSIYDNHKMTAQLTPDGWNRPPQLLQIEREALDRCYRGREEVLLESEGMRIEATFIDEGRGVERVILFLEGEER